MGAPATIRDRIDLGLWEITAEVAFLPELAEFWAQNPQEAGQSSFPYEWHNLMGRLETLHCTYRAGQMTPSQAERYRQLLQALQDALPLLQRLGFTLPQISLQP